MNPKEHSTLNDKILDIRETDKIMKAFPLTQYDVVQHARKLL